MNNREYIGKRIAEIRQDKGLSIRQLAEASGVNFANIYKIENGKYNVSIDILGKICEALGYHVDINPNMDEIIVTKEEIEEAIEGRLYMRYLPLRLKSDIAMSTRITPSFEGMAMTRGLLPTLASKPPHAGISGIVLVQRMPMHPASAAMMP